MPVTRLYTVEDVRAIPDDRNRYETIDGELFVTPGPALTHQRVLSRLFLLLGTYVARHSLGELFAAPTDVVFGPMTLVEPDLLFVAERRAAIMTEREIAGAPDLAVEILSPSTARTDRGRKRALYQKQGVREYWIVDIDLRRVEVWRPDAIEAQVYTETLTWQPEGGVEALQVDVGKLFELRR